MGVNFAKITLFVALLAVSGSSARSVEVIDVWLDVDTATGIGDVDDGLMLIQGFHSPEINIRGISVVFGNAPLSLALPIARTITNKFGPTELAPVPGAASANDFGKPNQAVAAIAAELKRRPMTIVAAGPVTNVGTLVKLHPELHGRIERIVMVAGRRPGQQFVANGKQKTPHRDFNFELDPIAMQAILSTKIPLVLAPWEVSSHVWISRDDLESLRNTSPCGAWIAETSQYWIERWAKNIDTRGFNPFDTLAVGWLTHPHLVESEELSVTIEEGPDDRTLPGQPPKAKPYLLARPSDSPTRSVIYCHTPKTDFKEMLLQRLGGS